MARKVSRDPELIRGVRKYTRSQMYHRRGLWAIKAKNGGVLPCHDPKPKPVAAPEKPPKYYPADDVKKPLVNKHNPRPTKLRASITPGTVLIILAGRFNGKRAVFLKQLSSGLLLITDQRCPFEASRLILCDCNVHQGRHLWRQRREIR